tara:strand:+ start:129 stop:356 length:228 start_codon:yes stop_codon:yes gene_type:complete
MSVTYKYDDKVYDPNNFKDEAKSYFNQVVQLQAEIETLHKQIAVLQAASITFNQRIREQLTDDMLIDESVEGGEL